jgi:hypothetical protein
MLRHVRSTGRSTDRAHRAIPEDSGQAASELIAETL